MIAMAAAVLLVVNRAEPLLFFVAWATDFYWMALLWFLLALYLLLVSYRRDQRWLLATSCASLGAALLTSELASNAVRHAHGTFTVTARMSADELYVAVTDSGAEIPVARTPEPTEPNGRGLMIVSTLADRWGVEPGEGGKAVWFTLALRVRG